MCEVDSTAACVSAVPPEVYFMQTHCLRVRRPESKGGYQMKQTDADKMVRIAAADAGDVAVLREVRVFVQW